MGRSAITALVLTCNEEQNIGRTLKCIAWVDRIVVVDSGSTDRTLQIIAESPQAEVFSRSFTTHGEQWNFGLGLVKTDWVLTLDADYQLPKKLEFVAAELLRGEFDGYYAGFSYLVYGRPIKGAILPPRLVLFRKDLGHYLDDGHTQLLKFGGKTGILPLAIEHDDRKPLSRWLESQVKYARLERDKLRRPGLERISLQDRIRTWMVLAPVLVFVIVYIVRGGFLSGWRGLFYALQRFYAELLLALLVLDDKLQRKDNS